MALTALSVRVEPPFESFAPGTVIKTPCARPDLSSRRPSDETDGCLRPMPPTMGSQVEG